MPLSWPVFLIYKSFEQICLFIALFKTQEKKNFAK